MSALENFVETGTTNRKILIQILNYINPNIKIRNKHNSLFIRQTIINNIQPQQYLHIESEINNLLALEEQNNFIQKNTNNIIKSNNEQFIINWLNMNRELTFTYHHSNSSDNNLDRDVVCSLYVQIFSQNITKITNRKYNRINFNNRTSHVKFKFLNGIPNDNILLEEFIWDNKELSTFIIAHPRFTIYNNTIAINVGTNPLGNIHTTIHIE
jgi:hypothetical protein